MLPEWLVDSLRRVCSTADIPAEVIVDRAAGSAGRHGRQDEPEVACAPVEYSERIVAIRPDNGCPQWNAKDTRVALSLAHRISHVVSGYSSIRVSKVSGQ